MIIVHCTKRNPCRRPKELWTGITGLCSKSSPCSRCDIELTCGCSCIEIDSSLQKKFQLTQETNFKLWKCEEWKSLVKKLINETSAKKTVNENDDKSDKSNPKRKYDGNNNNDCDGNNNKSLKTSDLQ